MSKSTISTFELFQMFPDDTYYDDLTDDRIRQLEHLALSWRWMSADGERV